MLDQWCYVPYHFFRTDEDFRCFLSQVWSPVFLQDVDILPTFEASTWVFRNEVDADDGENEDPGTDNQCKLAHRDERTCVSKTLRHNGAFEATRQPNISSFEIYVITSAAVPFFRRAFFLHHSKSVENGDVRPKIKYEVVEGVIVWLDPLCQYIICLLRQLWRIPVNKIWYWKIPKSQQHHESFELEMLACGEQ